MAKLPKLKQSVKVTPTKEDGPVSLSVSVKFDPKDIDPERAKRIYEGIAALIGSLMEPLELAKFAAKLNRERAKLANARAKA